MPLCWAYLKADVKYQPRPQQLPQPRKKRSASERSGLRSGSLSEDLQIGLNEWRRWQRQRMSRIVSDLLREWSSSYPRRFSNPTASDRRRHYPARLPEHALYPSFPESFLSHLQELPGQDASFLRPWSGQIRMWRRPPRRGSFHYVASYCIDFVNSQVLETPSISLSRIPI